MAASSRQKCPMSCVRLRLLSQTRCCGRSLFFLSPYRSTIGGKKTMNFLNTFASLFSNFGNLTWQMVVMWGIGALLIYLAIAKKMEPSLLLPMGFGAILVNLPLSGAITQGDTVGPISALFEAGMSNELFPLLLFIGIGAMIDFGPLLEKPWLMLFGRARRQARQARGAGPSPWGTARGGPRPWAGAAPCTGGASPCAPWACPCRRRR